MRPKSPSIYLQVKPIHSSDSYIQLVVRHCLELPRVTPGHTCFSEKEHGLEAQQCLAPCRNIFLLLPDVDSSGACQILAERRQGDRPEPDIDGLANIRALRALKLEKQEMSTGMSPREMAEAILARLRTPAQISESGGKRDGSRKRVEKPATDYTGLGVNGRYISMSKMGVATALPSEIRKRNSRLRPNFRLSLDGNRLSLEIQIIALGCKFQLRARALRHLGSARRSCGGWPGRRGRSRIRWDCSRQSEPLHRARNHCAPNSFP